MKIEEMTKSDKEVGNKLYRLLQTNRTITKEEMLDYLGWEKNSSNDRKLRDLLNAIGNKVGLISVSSGKGYKLSGNDLEGVEHALAEWQSRNDANLARMIPLYKDRERIKRNTENIGESKKISLKELLQIVKEHSIKEDVKIVCNGNFSFFDTFNNSVYYSKEENTLFLTQSNDNFFIKNKNYIRLNIN